MRFISLLCGTFTQTAALFTSFVFVYVYFWEYVSFSGSPNKTEAGEAAAISLVAGFGIALAVGGVVAFRVGRGLCTLMGVLLMVLQGLALGLLDISAAGLVFPAFGGAVVGFIAAGGFFERAGLLGIGVSVAVGLVANQLEDAIEADGLRWLEGMASHLPWVLGVLLAVSVLNVWLSFRVVRLRERWISGPLELL